MFVAIFLYCIPLLYLAAIHTFMVWRNRIAVHGAIVSVDEYKARNVAFTWQKISNMVLLTVIPGVNLLWACIKTYSLFIDFVVWVIQTYRAKLDKPAYDINTMVATEVERRKQLHITR